MRKQPPAPLSLRLSPTHPWRREPVWELAPASPWPWEWVGPVYWWEPVLASAPLDMPPPPKERREQPQTILWLTGLEQFLETKPCLSLQIPTRLTQSRSMSKSLGCEPRAVPCFVRSYVRTGNKLVASAASIRNPSANVTSAPRRSAALVAARAPRGRRRVSASSVRLLRQPLHGRYLVDHSHLKRLVRVKPPARQQQVQCPSSTDNARQ